MQWIRRCLKQASDVGINVLLIIDATAIKCTRENTMLGMRTVIHRAAKTLSKSSRNAGVLNGGRASASVNASVNACVNASTGTSMSMTSVRAGTRSASSSASSTAGSAAESSTSASEKAVTGVAPPGDGPNHRSVMTLDGYTIRPFVQPNVFVAPSASVIGSVMINDSSFIMYGGVIRGDLALIHIGAFTVIGENSVITAGEVSDGLSPSDAVAAGLPIEPELVVGDLCHVGACVNLQSCFLDGDNVVGHGCTIGKGSRMGRFAELLPRSFVGEGVQIPEGEVWGGCPAVKVGTLTSEVKDKRRADGIKIGELTSAHAWEFLPGGSVYWEKEALEKEKQMSSS